MGRSAINRVLVVGHKKLSVSNPILSFCAWENLRHLPDISDFDVVVVDLLTLPENIEDVDWNSFLRKFDVDAFRKVVLPGGQFVVVGDPRLSIPISGEVKGTCSILGWTGFSFDFENDEGRNIRYTTDYRHKFAERYLKRLQRYTWAYESSEHASSRGKNRWHDGDDRVRLDETVLACSRSNHAVALRLSLMFEVYRQEYGYGSWRHASTHGSVWLLPEINETPEETVRLILADFFGVSLGAEEPSWASDITLPNEGHLREELASVEEQMAALQSKEAELLAAIEEARKPLKLLYDSGESLEDVVLSVLESLGGEVSKPDVKGEEDGWASIEIGDEVRHFVLEVKGVTTDHLGEDGLKQLPHWVQKGILQREIRPKGLLVGTAARNKPLNERQPPFSDNFRKKAQLSGFAVLTGIDLLVAHLKDLQGLLDRDRFWRVLWETNGVVDLSSAIKEAPALQEPERSAESDQVSAM